MQTVLVTGRFLQRRVQDAPSALFSQLQAGDVLFIDTSHVLKVQSDVEHELLRVLPILANGVWLHFHDVFTPYDYPNEWILGTIRHVMNEQYAVECLLTGGDRYQVALPLHLLAREHRSAMQKFFPRCRQWGQSFWLRKTGENCPAQA
jgi:hypothetical protein